MTIHENEKYFENQDATVRVTKQTGGVSFTNTDSLRLYVSVSTKKDISEAQVGIYGSPNGLRQLAELLFAIASIDQSQISERNCPLGEGMHTTLHAGTNFPGTGISLNVGRLDCKKDGSTNWLSLDDEVTWTQVE